MFHKIIFALEDTRTDVTLERLYVTNAMNDSEVTPHSVSSRKLPVANVTLVLRVSAFRLRMRRVVVSVHC